MKIKCKNVTHAMKGKRLLENHGITASVQKLTSSEGSMHGCVYIIELPDYRREQALSLLKQNRIQLHRDEQELYEEVD